MRSISVVIGLAMLLGTSATDAQVFDAEAVKKELGTDLKTNILKKLESLATTDGFSATCTALSERLPEIGKNAKKKSDLAKRTERALIDILSNNVGVADQEAWIIGFDDVMKQLQAANGDSLADWKESFELGAKLLAAAAKKHETKQAKAVKDDSDQEKSDPKTNASQFVESLDQFGITARLQELVFREAPDGYDLPRKDLEPDDTANGFVKMYENLAKRVEKMKATGKTEFLQELGAEHKKQLDKILGAEPGREEDWRDLFKELLAGEEYSLQRIINEGKFDVRNPDHFEQLFKQMASGFEEVAKEMERKRKEKGSGSGIAAESGGSGSGAYGSGSSFAAVHHARAMSRIYRRHQRRSYRIQRINARR